METIMLWFKSSPARSGSDNKRQATYLLEDLKADIVDKVSAAIMMVDRDLVVTYVNDPTKELLKKNAAAFRAIWPTFDPDRIVGTCIDSFHKNPAHQRKMLSDPSRLPIRTEITIGDLKISLSVNGSFDRKGNHVGNILEWLDVTKIRLNEGMISAINKAQAVIEFTVDGKALHANENFLRTLGYTLDEIRGQHHGMFVDPAYRQSAEYRMFWEKLGRG
jgi:methyl-accepting chemotaxis protein